MDTTRTSLTTPVPGASVRVLVSLILGLFLLIL